MTIKRVGNHYQVNGKMSKLSYKNAPCDKYGWVDPKVCLPGEYDLVCLRIKDSPCVTAWISGNTWDGLKLKESYDITGWKRRQDDEE